MADIRINALATTATSSASDDYIAIDGSANGTRKLSVYSPTFGGNASVSGTLGVGTSTPTYKLDVVDNSTGVQGRLSSSSSSGTSFALTNTATNGRIYRIGSNFVTGTGEFALYDDTAGAVRLTVSSAGNTTLAGNLTVSGGKATVSNSDDARVAPTGSVLITNGNYGSTTTMGKLLLSGGAGNNSTQSGWYLGSQNTAGVGGPQPYLDIGLASTDTVGGYGTFTSQARITSGGNLLLGTTTDSGFKLQVNGTGQFADKLTVLRGAGNSTSIDGNFDDVRLRGVSGQNCGYAVAMGSATDAGGYIIATPAQNRSVAFLGINGSAYIQTNNGSTALTLDSSQRTILSGPLRLANAYVAGAPSATGYVTIQDSAGTTYKVLVST